MSCPKISTPNCSNNSEFCGKIAEVPAQIQQSKIGSAITQYVNLPINTLNLLTVPLSQKMVQAGIWIGGERYERHCQTAAMVIACDAIDTINAFLENPIGEESGAAPCENQTAKTGFRSKLNAMGEGIYSLSNWIHGKGENFDDSSWMAVRGLGKAVKLASYPVAVGSYIPSAMSHAGEKLPEVPWAKMEENDPRRLIAENIYAPLIANIDRAAMEKEVRIGLDAAAIGTAYLGLSHLCSYTQNMAMNGIGRGDVLPGFHSNTSKLAHAALAANGIAWVAGPALSKGKDLLTNDIEAQIEKVKDAIIEKNPQLVSILQKIDGMTEIVAKETLELLLMQVLETRASRLNFIGSDEKTIEMLSKFPAVKS